MVASVTPADIRAVMASLVKEASSGDVAAAKLLFDRVIGKMAVESSGGVQMLESAAGPVVLEDSDLPALHTTFSDILAAVFETTETPVKPEPVARTKAQGRTRKAGQR
jgi:hypothetical protein